MIPLATVVQIGKLLREQGVNEAAMSRLRTGWPHIHFTCCSEDDVHSGKPVQEHALFSLYLVDSSEHCLCLTNDHDIATGLVVAEHCDEEA